MGNDIKGWSWSLQQRQYMFLEFNIAMSATHTSIDTSSDEGIENSFKRIRKR